MAHDGIGWTGEPPQAAGSKRRPSSPVTVGHKARMMRIEAVEHVEAGGAHVTLHDRDHGFSLRTRSSVGSSRVPQPFSYRLFPPQELFPAACGPAETSREFSSTDRNRWMGAAPDGTQKRGGSFSRAVRLLLVLLPR